MPAKTPFTPNLNLCCFVARQFLLRIYALFGVLFTGLKMRWRTKKTNVRYGSLGEGSTGVLPNMLSYKFSKPPLDVSTALRILALTPELNNTI